MQPINTAHYNNDPYAGPLLLPAIPERADAEAEADEKAGSVSEGRPAENPHRPSSWVELQDITSYLTCEKILSAAELNIDSEDERGRTACIDLHRMCIEPGMGQEFVREQGLKGREKDSVFAYSLNSLFEMEGEWEKKVNDYLKWPTHFFLLGIEYIFQFLCDPKNSAVKRLIKANVLPHLFLKNKVTKILACKELHDAEKILCFRILYARAFGKEEEAKAAREELDKSLKAPRPTTAPLPPAASAAAAAAAAPAPPPVAKPTLPPDQFRSEVQKASERLPDLNGFQNILKSLPACDLKSKIESILKAPITEKEKLLKLHIYCNEVSGNKNQAESLRKELMAYYRFVEAVETSIRNIGAPQPVLAMTEKTGDSFVEAVDNSVRECDKYVSRTNFDGHCLTIINATGKRMRVQQNPDRDAAEFPTRITIDESEPERKQLFCDFNAAKKWELIVFGKIQPSKKRPGETVIDATFLEVGGLKLEHTLVFSENYSRGQGILVPAPDSISTTVVMDLGVVNESYTARGLTDAEYQQLKQATHFFRSGKENLLLIDLTCIAGKIDRIFPKHIAHYLRAVNSSSLALRHDGLQWRIVHLVDPVQMGGRVRFLTSEESTLKSWIQPTTEYGPKGIIENTPKYRTDCRFVLQISPGKVEVIDTRLVYDSFVLPCVLSAAVDDPTNQTMSTLDELYRGIISGRTQIAEEPLLLPPENRYQVDPNMFISVAWGHPEGSAMVTRVERQSTGAVVAVVEDGLLTDLAENGSRISQVHLVARGIKSFDLINLLSRNYPRLGKIGGTVDPQFIQHYTETPRFRKVARDTNAIVEILQEEWAQKTGLPPVLNKIIASYSAGFHFTEW